MRLFTQNVKVAALGHAPLFEGLSKKELAKLASATDDLQVAPGTVLCREGRLGREFFAIVDGEAEVTKSGKRIGTCSGGDFVGEIALLSTKKRTATVTGLINALTRLARRNRQPMAHTIPINSGINPAARDKAATGVGGGSRRKR